MGKRAVPSVVKSAAAGEEDDSERGLQATAMSHVVDSLNLEGLSTKVGEILAAKIAGLVSEQSLAEDSMATHGDQLASQLKREVLARMLRDSLCTPGGGCVVGPTH